METRWAAADRPDYSAMSVTTALADVGAGDTTTGESASDVASASGCGWLIPAPVLTAQTRLGSIHAVTGASWALTLTDALSGSGGSPCTESFISSSSGMLTLEGFIGGSWQPLHSESLTPPTIPVNRGDSYEREISGSILFDEVLTCDVRLVVEFESQIWSPTSTNSSHTGTIDLTDWRMVMADTEDPCTGSGGSGGGDGGGGGGGEESDPDPDPCGCTDWTPKPTSSGTWAPASVCSTSWTPKRCQ